MSYWKLLLISLLLPVCLTTCGTASSSIADICPVAPEYTKEFLGQAVTEYDALPESDTLKVMITDYRQVRKEIVVCNKSFH